MVSIASVAGKHGVGSVIILGERMENTGARLPFRVGAATSAAAIPHKCQVSRDRMARQFVYFMQGLSKTYPGNRKVLDNVHLSFYPDAKIGVLGVNGSGKSTLLRIMAGIGKEYNGAARGGGGGPGGISPTGAPSRPGESGGG